MTRVDDFWVCGRHRSPEFTRVGGKPVATGIVVGTHRARLDAGGRLRLPMAWRQAFAPRAGGSVVMLGKPGPYVTLLTEARSRRMLKLMESASPDKVVQDERSRSIRSLTNDLAIATLDANGWLEIPKKLRRAANLKSAVVLVGTLYTAEVWAADQWRVYAAENEKSFLQTAIQLGI